MPKKSVKSSKPNTSKSRKSRSSKTKTPNAKKSTEIGLSVPWGGDGNYVVSNNYFETDTDKSPQEFIRERTRLHELYILEEAKTKRLTLVIAGILFLSAVAVILFAPEGRQNLSYWLGGTLFVLSAGAAGYKRIWGKTKNRSVRLE